MAFPPGAATLAGGALVAVAALLFVLAWRAYGRRRLILDTPTAKVASMALGPVELKGTALPAPGVKPLLAPLTGEPCLHWTYRAEEERTRTVTRTVNGKTQTRTERYWATVDSAEARVPFVLRDETGTAPIDPEGATLPAPAVARFGSGLLQDPPTHVVDFLRKRNVDHEGWFGLNKTMRYTEARMPVGIPLYVLGTARRPDNPREEATGNAALVVGKGPDAPFVVSDKDEESLARRHGAVFLAFLAGAVALAAVGTALLTGGL